MPAQKHFFFCGGLAAGQLPLRNPGILVVPAGNDQPIIISSEKHSWSSGKPRGNNGNTGVVVTATYWLFCHVISHAYFFLRTYRATLAAVFTTIATLFLQKKMHIFF